MMHSTKKIRFTSAAIALSCAFGIAATTSAQDQKPVVEKPSAKRISYSGRDPFRKFEPPRPAGKRTQNTVAIPSIQERIAQYRAQKVAAMNARMAAPKPTTALLLSEMQVVGISDRKSTRLNSSHLVISYAVFCLKKKITSRGGPPATWS